MFSIQLITGTISNLPDGSDQNPPTPQTSVIFKNSNNIKVGHFGKLEFLDNKASFAEVLG